MPITIPEPVDLYMAEGYLWLGGAGAVGQWLFRYTTANRIPVENVQSRTSRVLRLRFPDQTAYSAFLTEGGRQFPNFQFV